MEYISPYGGKYDVDIVFSTYSNGRVALVLTDVDDGMQIVKATVNMPDVHLEKDEVIIKNWSENEGVLAFLQLYGYVGQTIRRIPTGHLYADICKLLKTS